MESSRTHFDIRALEEECTNFRKQKKKKNLTRLKVSVGMKGYLTTRGGVEDTRLEAKAKAKDTKKIRGQGQGQGQPFRGQTLSRPRTGMLEAKAKDQGHSRKCSPKKKGLQKSFSDNLQFKGVARIFDWGGLNHKSHAMTSSKICLFLT